MYWCKIVHCITYTIIAHSHFVNIHNFTLRLQAPTSFLVTEIPWITSSTFAESWKSSSRTQHSYVSIVNVYATDTQCGYTCKCVYNKIIIQVNFKPPPANIHMTTKHHQSLKLISVTHIATKHHPSLKPISVTHMILPANPQDYIITGIYSQVNLASNHRTGLTPTIISV